MTLKKGFLRSSQFKPGGWLIFNGVFISTFFTIFFFFILTTTFEVFRVYNHKFWQSTIILSNSEIVFFNFLWALLSSAIGQSFGLRLVFQNVQVAPRTKTRLNKRLALHSIESNMWVWVHYTTRMLLILGLTYISFGLQNYWESKKDLWILFTLFPSYWFLMNWLNLHRLLKKDYYRWLLKGLVHWILVAAIVAPFAPFSSKVINDFIKTNTPEIRHHIKLPKAQAFQEIQHEQQYVEKLFMATINGSSRLIVRHFSNEEIIELNINKVYEYASSLSKYADGSDKEQIKFLLTVNPDIPLSDVLLFEKWLARFGYHKLLYRVTPENSDVAWYDSNFELLGIPKPLLQSCDNAKPLLDSLKNIGYKANELDWPKHDCYTLVQKLNKNRVLIKHDSSGLKLNGRPIDLQELRSKLTVLIKKYRSNLNILYQPDIKMNFEEYLKVKDVLMQCVLTNRLSYTLDNYDYAYHWKELPPYPSKQLSIHQETEALFPMNIVELTGWNLEFYKYLKE